MNLPVTPQDVKLVRGRSPGLQVVCNCGCTNFNYLDPQDTVWRCRNCRQILSYDFPRLLEQALPLLQTKPAETTKETPAATT